MPCAAAAKGTDTTLCPFSHNEREIHSILFIFIFFSCHFCHYAFFSEILVLHLKRVKALLYNDTGEKVLFRLRRSSRKTKLKPNCSNCLDLKAERFGKSNS